MHPAHVPVQPLLRRRSRLGEPTVRIELVVIDSNGQLGKELLRRQASAVKLVAATILGGPLSPTPIDLD